MSAISSERCEMSASSRGTMGGRRSAKVFARAMCTENRSPAADASTPRRGAPVPASRAPPRYSRSMTPDTDLRRRLPSVDHLVQDPAVRALEARHGRMRVVAEARRLVEEARDLAAVGRREELERALGSVASRLAARLEASMTPSLVKIGRAHV